MLAKFGVTAAMVAEYAETNNLSDEKAAEILLTHEQNKAGQNGIFMRIAAALGLRKENDELKKLDATKKTSIATTIAQTVAQWAQNVAAWAGCPPMLALTLVIIGIIAAIALLVVGIIALV
jgi:hypothetical protein